MEPFDDLRLTLLRYWTIEDSLRWAWVLGCRGCLRGLLTKEYALRGSGLFMWHSMTTGHPNC